MKFIDSSTCPFKEKQSRTGAENSILKEATTMSNQQDFI
jgi:hypothetical protein